MGMKDFYKKIRYRLSRDYCYDEMERSGDALLNCCGGVVGGDMHSLYLSYDCIGCPYFVEGFSARKYREDILEKRKEAREMGLDKLTETTLMKITYLDFYIDAIDSKLKDMSEVERRTVLNTQIEAIDMIISKLRPLYEKYYVGKDGQPDELDEETIRAILLENESETNKKSE